MKKRRLTAMLLCLCMTASTITPVLANEDVDYTENSEEITYVSDVPDGYVGIYTAEDLDNIRNRSESRYILMNDIDLLEYENWEPISSAKIQIFDGNGYTISNMNIDDEEADTQYYGLFGCITREFTVSNLNIANSNIYITSSGDVTVGAICGMGENKTTFLNCSSDTEIIINSEGNIYCGGIAGISTYIEGCVNYGNISIESLFPTESSDSDGVEVYLGGCSGKSRQDVIDNINYGELTSFARATQYLGGIVGHASNNIGNNNNYGLIDIDAVNLETVYVGGICGKNSTSGKVYNCNNMGSISLVDGIPKVWCGGIIGYSFREITHCINKANINIYGGRQLIVGGICGHMNIADVINSANTGNITIDVENKACIGGIIGDGDNLRSCYNTGDIDVYAPTLAYVGGIYGANTGYPNISDLYNTGNISATSEKARVGGIIGGAYRADITTSYNLGNVEAISIDEGESTAGNIRSGTIGLSDSYQVVDSYYLSSALVWGDETIIRGTPLSETEFCDATNFEGFDFDSVWEIGVTDGYPYPTLKENPHIILNNDTDADYPAPVLVIDSQDGENVVFIWNYCEGAVEYEFIVTYSSGETSCYTIPATDNPNTSYTFGTTFVSDWTYCVYAVYEDGTRVASNIVVGDKSEIQLAPTVTGLQDNYTISQGESLTVNFTVTAGDGANLKVVTVQNSATGINCYRQPDISVNSHTVSCTIPVNGLDVGTHKFIVYASADNYTVTDNNVGMFTVTISDGECNHTGLVEQKYPLSYPVFYDNTYHIQSYDIKFVCEICGSIVSTDNCTEYEQHYCVSKLGDSNASTATGNECSCGYVIDSIYEPWIGYLQSFTEKITYDFINEDDKGISYSNSYVFPHYDITVVGEYGDYYLIEYSGAMIYSRNRSSNKTTAKGYIKKEFIDDTKYADYLNYSIDLYRKDICYENYTINKYNSYRWCLWDSDYNAVRMSDDYLYDKYGYNTDFQKSDFWVEMFKDTELKLCISDSIGQLVSSSENIRLEYDPEMITVELKDDEYGLGYNITNTHKSMINVQRPTSIKIFIDNHEVLYIQLFLYNTDNYIPEHLNESIHGENGDGVYFNPTQSGMWISEYYNEIIDYAENYKSWNPLQRDIDKKYRSCGVAGYAVPYYIFLSPHDAKIFAFETIIYSHEQIRNYLIEACFDLVANVDEFKDLDKVIASEFIDYLKNNPIEAGKLLFDFLYDSVTDWGNAKAVDLMLTANFDLELREEIESVLVDLVISAFLPYRIQLMTKAFDLLNNITIESGVIEKMDNIIDKANSGSWLYLLINCTSGYDVHLIFDDMKHNFFNRKDNYVLGSPLACHSIMGNHISSQIKGYMNYDTETLDYLLDKIRELRDNKPIFLP